MIRNNSCPLANPIRLPVNIRIPPGSPPSSSSESDSDSEPPRRPVRSERRPTPLRLPNRRWTDIDPQQRDLEEEIMNTIEETRKIPMESRPKFIKLQENNKLKMLVKQVNTGLTSLVPEDATLS
ncbi:hypothetical protein Pmani_015633 [Petrolisthes manimaculis]|uniref:Uncharacterized protein n=1 Tax=Petrolisthes manimaculis TaxID=1843537 RepID=A0AAE1PRR4_9EUCA|nr:hypothetical protein Pmani_015633 [Petrolisthes manimaculis]